jgi:hypothetical protein
MADGAHLSNLLVCAVAALERRHGTMAMVPPGPRRDRMLRYSGRGAVAAASGPSCLGGPAFAVEMDGTAEQVAGVAWEPPNRQEPPWPG